MESLSESASKFKTEIFEETRDEAVANPFGHYKALREQDPIARIRHGDDDIYILTRMEDVVDVLRRADVFSNRRAGGPKAAAIHHAVAEAIEAYPDVAHLIEKLGEPAAPVLDLADPPDHTRQRGLIGTRFMPAQVKELEGKVRDYVNGLIDLFIGAGKVELVEQFSAKLPLWMITEILGIPEDMRDTMRRWTDDQVSLMGNPTMSVEDGRRIAVTNVEFFNYYSGLIDERRANPGSDLVSEIVTRNEAMEEPLSLAELIGIFHQLSGAGHETTRNLITASMLTLVDNPELFAQLKANPDLVPNFVEEMLRLETPSIGMFRNVVEDTKIGSTPIPKDSLVWLLYAAANRDPEVYTDPDKVDVSRSNLRQHLSFGQGRHSCIGAALARMETKIAITELVRRLDDLALVPGARVEYGRSYILRGIPRLDLTFTGD